MADKIDAAALLHEEVKEHERTRVELGWCRACCYSWQTACQEAWSNMNQLSAQVTHLEQMLFANQTRNLQLSIENGRLNLTIRHLVPWAAITSPPASCPSLASDVEAESVATDAYEDREVDDWDEELDELDELDGEHA